MKAFLRKILSYLLMLGKVWSRAKPPPAPAADISREMPEESAAALGREHWRPSARVLSNRYPSQPVPDGKWVMRYHRGRH